ncbi:MAG: LacI family DNA-binding transcriptional regulator [Oceanipulchritudo sp.]
MATLKEVAAAAGVHPTTVSCIVNGAKGNSRFTEETRARVLRAAEKLGYKPNQLARQLKWQRTRTIGFIGGNIRNPFFALLTTCLERELQARGYDLLLRCRGSDGDRWNAGELQDFSGKPIDGLLVWSEDVDAAAVKALSPSLPCVVLCDALEALPAVIIDIRAGLRAAVRHLAAQGHERLAYFAPAAARAATGRPGRASLFAEVVRDEGLPKPVNWIFPGDSWDLAAARDAATTRMQTAARATAVVAYNDVAACGWLLAARQRDGALPVVAFDGTDLPRLLYPQAASVDLRISEIAHAAARAIMDRLDRPGAAAKSVRVAPRMVSHTG